ncbi:glycerate kinase [Robiginitalea sp.]|uniref:glycerate kinase n=1 Tax=Robiginitalea sp. TaxID=1902411 RepID=UPI003C77F1F6
MRIALIPDKFKGSLTAAQVCDAMEAGIRLVYPGAEIRRFAASDGGDGFLEAVLAVRPMEVVQVPVTDPLGREVNASFLHDPKTGEAYIEMARASGMELLTPGERNPIRTDTRGTGQLILKAAQLGARHIFVGLGGSGTNDGGCGIASVFGYRFLDSNQKELPPVGGSLEGIARILPPANPVLPKSVRITAVYDVNNPLWGPQGAAQVYAAQKGASPQDIQRLDAGLQNLEERVREQLGVDAGHLPGAGAAGGTAFGLKCFLGADFTNGTDLVLRLNGFEQYLREPKTDYVFTGEGRIDTQTLNGKLIQGVLQLASARKCPVVAVCGQCDAPLEALSSMGFEAVLQVSDPHKSLAYAMEHAYELVSDSVQGFLRQKK